MPGLYVCSSCCHIKHISCSIFYGGKFTCPECFKDLGICTNSDDVAELDFQIVQENLFSISKQKVTIPEANASSGAI